MRKIARVLIFCCCVVSLKAMGQFYYQGRSSADIKWEQLKSNKYKLIYPNYFRPTAIGISNFLDSIIPLVSYGMPNQSVRIPIILETQNNLSNGLVVWAPKREELVTVAPPNTYASPWLKQLSVHEFRHVVQMSNLNVGMIKVGTYIIGEAAMGVGSIVISRWQFEGDATNAETQLAEFGRGLQPEFTIGYRAMFEHKEYDDFLQDNFMIQSFKNYYPNLYKYGYQIVRATETYTNNTKIWGEIFEYSGKWPIFVYPDLVYLYKYYNKISFTKIRKRTFDDLKRKWQPFAIKDNNYQTVIIEPIKTYTTYEYPLLTDDSKIITFKTDFLKAKRLVEIDAKGIEKHLKYVGLINSPIAQKENNIYWTEYAPHPIYEKKNYSIIRTLNLNNNKIKTINRWESNYFVTPLDSGYATAKHDRQSRSYIQFWNDKFEKIKQYHFDTYTTLHGLAWDRQTQTLSFIALDDRGMRLGAVHKDDLSTDAEHKIDLPQSKELELKKASLVTMRDLKADSGTLYFSSIHSGKDEVHSLDIKSKIEMQLTSSKFGAISPTAKGDTIYMTGYSADGWLIAKASIQELLNDTIKWSRLPQNKVNPDWVKWDIDTLISNISISDTVKTLHEIKKYRKNLRLFNVHSWMPFTVDIEELLNERDFSSIGLGATGFFQSTLSDMYGSLALGVKNKEFWTSGSFTYTGLPVQILFGAEYGGGEQQVLAPALVKIPQRDQFLKIKTKLFIPFNFSSGHSLRTLQPSFDVEHYNTLLYNRNAGTFDKGYQKWNTSLWWSSTMRSAYRAMTPRLGYATQISVSGAFNDRFSKQYSVWAKGYLPGIMLSHSMTLKTSYQWQQQNEFNFNSKINQPRGVINNNLAKTYQTASLDYTMPLLYPDWGINGLLYFNRIGLNLFGDYALGEYFRRGTATDIEKIMDYSYGVDLLVNFAVLRSSTQQMYFRFAFPNNQFNFSVGFSLSL